MALLDVAAGGTPLAGAAVYLWHCNIDGQYSMYDEDIAGENYLRGVQESGSDGKVTFKSVFPAAYAGRWPHIHFEVYESLEAATSGGSKLKTSQIALPKEACDLVYATDGYAQSVQSLTETSLDTDMVFSDGYASQLATTSGTRRQRHRGQAERRRLIRRACPRRAGTPPRSAPGRGCRGSTLRRTASAPRRTPLRARSGARSPRRRWSGRSAP